MGIIGNATKNWGDLQVFFIRTRRICKERRIDNVKELTPLMYLIITV